MYGGYISMGLVVIQYNIVFRMGRMSCDFFPDLQQP